MGMDIFITKLLLLLLILSVTPPVLSDRWHPHLNNASDQHALLRFVSEIVAYDPSQTLPSTWKPNVSFCHWAGVICNRRRQRVVSLNVSSMGLQEYGLGGRITTKGDVYSYGIVLLEILTGKKPTHNMFVEGMTLQKWVGSSFPNQVRAVVDRSLLRRTCTSTVEEKEINCLSQLVSVGLLCTKESPEGRPPMMDVVGKLESFKENFLGVVRNPNSDITDLLGRPSTTHNNIGESQSSSTF